MSYTTPPSELDRYEEWTQRLAHKYPNLRHQDNKRWHPYLGTLPTRVACVDFGPNDHVELRVGKGVTDLRAFYESPVYQSNADPVRRLFILEEFDNEIKAAIGIRLSVDPRVFQRQSRVALWERSDENAGCTPSLPSLNDPNKSFILNYNELMHLNVEDQQFTLRCVGNERHIASSRNGDKLDGVGSVHRRLSFWAKGTKNDGWDAMLIVDAPLHHAMYGSRKDNSVARQKAKPAPFQGGYQDFIPYISTEEALRIETPPRTSIFDDLCFYHKLHNKHLRLTSSPSSASLFAQKIVVSEYMLLIEYYRNLLFHLGWGLSRRDGLDGFEPPSVERAWSDLQASQRRLDEHHRNVKLAQTALQLSEPLSPPHWTDTSADFLHIEDEIQRLRNHASGLLSSFTSLAGIVGNRQSLDEARSVRVLTILGMTFLPLSLIASLLSMGGKFLPGESGFWIYWVASVPTVILVYALLWGAVRSLKWVKLLQREK